MPIKLDNGEFLSTIYGKYKPNLTFLGETGFESQHDLPWNQCNLDTFNLEPLNASVLSGQYWVSRKGTHCFRVMEDGPHLLIQESDTSELRRISQPLYYRHASSNGGGKWYNYAVIPNNFKYNLGLDDI